MRRIGRIFGNFRQSPLRLGRQGTPAPGGSANLAETDELIGAEAYVLQNVRDLATARNFLAKVANFKERVAWHGESAQGNPSGGNILRGLYNIVIKSLGAATKRHPDVRLDYVIDYAQRMTEPGYYFMDSPGNDLESLAGQVASGTNLIFFTTGNGSVTNFPFVPTIKIVTTSGRFRLLARDMDFNAGAFLEETPLPDLGRELLDLTLQVASGRRSVGEKAGHSQVSLWRNWQQTDGSNLVRLQNVRRPRVEVPIRLKPPVSGRRLRFDGIRTPGGWVTRQIGLILPTSLCSSQIARLLAQRLTRSQAGEDRSVSRFVALPHTEGCGCSGGQTRQLYSRTLLGHLTHPTVAAGLFLEHGCEATHNDYMTSQLVRMGGDVESYGKASIQLDGGIEKVGNRVETWFHDTLSGRSAPRRQAVGLESLRMAVLTSGRVTEAACRTLSTLVQRFVYGGATIVIPQGDTLLESPAWREILLEPDPLEPTLLFGGKGAREGPADHGSRHRSRGRAAHRAWGHGSGDPPGLGRTGTPAGSRHGSDAAGFRCREHGRGPGAGSGSAPDGPSRAVGGEAVGPGSGPGLGAIRAGPSGPGKRGFSDHPGSTRGFSVAAVPGRDGPSIVKPDPIGINVRVPSRGLTGR